MFAGHSQGGGEAAVIGTLRRVRGVISLSSPPDTNDLHVAALWLSTVKTGATPLDRYVAFVHVGDPFARIRADWTAMGLDTLGRTTSVEVTGPPYAKTHELISSAALPPVVLATHDSPPWTRRSRVPRRPVYVHPCVALPAPGGRRPPSHGVEARLHHLTW